MRICLLLLLLYLNPVWAIEKCLTADGRTLYSDAPCPPGSKRTGGVEAVPPLDPGTQERLREEREQMQREVERLENNEAAERALRAKEAASAREESRRAEQDALQRRQAEALERLARERENQPIYIGPPAYVPPRYPRPPINRPAPPVKEEEKRYEMAPFPTRKP